MLTWIVAAALAGTPADAQQQAAAPTHALTLETVLSTEGTNGEITTEAAAARVASASARLDAMLEQEGWHTSTHIEGLDRESWYGPHRQRLHAWTHADEWTYTPSKHGIVGGVAEENATERLWESSFVQSNVKLTRSAGVVSEVAFFSREIVGERMPSELTVAIWIRFEDGEPAEAYLRSTRSRGFGGNIQTHWTFTSDDTGGLVSAAEIALTSDGRISEDTEPERQASVRTWGTPNS